ncbi:hypothetical protein M430DRAFT_263685 [Amorphotheca resinae ATCC 22711]|uniref:Uncharacterized protein n=1 Tax=Amorphotheca resinae ATCC 22711 TaxID=857342 RepID=A0A2T3AWF9_AMORE|nr:hypothetical protein M430DRAFT_263685 [Amorphotheca resinae ATCC 22711]PSS13017.1 hypothetical protein M430DRAFT_263685 [Amorphotheca resinae ATCC 22711]
MTTYSTRSCVSGTAIVSQWLLRACFGASVCDFNVSRGDPIVREGGVGRETQMCGEIPKVRKRWGCQWKEFAP